MSALTHKRQSDWLNLCLKHGCKSYNDLELFIGTWYIDQQLSASQISKKLLDEDGFVLGTRCVQRMMARVGLIRSNVEGFRLAVKQNRVPYHRKEVTNNHKRIKLDPKKRSLILN